MIKTTTNPLSAKSIPLQETFNHKLNYNPSKGKFKLPIQESKLIKRLTLPTNKLFDAVLINHSSAIHLLYKAAHNQITGKNITKKDKHNEQ